MGELVQLHQAVSMNTTRKQIVIRGSDLTPTFAQPHTRNFERQDQSHNIESEQ
jgi:hypothetical protein